VNLSSPEPSARPPQEEEPHHAGALAPEEATPPGRAGGPQRAPGSRAGARVRNLAARVGTAIALGPGLLLSLFLGPLWIFETIALAAIAVAASELMGMALPNHAPGRVWGVVATVGVTLLLLHPFPGAAVVGLVGLSIGGVLVSLSGARPIETAAFRLGWLIAGPVYVGGLLGTLVLLHRLPSGGSWVLLAMLLAWLGDTGAYFAGWRFGKTQLAPVISPAKTLEGALGGLAGSVLGALLGSFWYLPSLPVFEGIGLALLAGSFGQIGDLGESLLKRSTGVKDSGVALPGHGGLLDRVDALMMTAAVVWLYATYIRPPG